jgi:hypothetical protein
MAAAAAAVPSIAAAASRFPTAEPEVGPVLAGSKLLWAVERRKDGGFDLRQTAPGDAPSTLESFSPPPLTISLFPQLAASPERIALAATAGDTDTSARSRTVFTAAAGGPFETLDRDCDRSGAQDFPRPVDVSGQLVVYPRCTSQGTQEVVVRDYSTPTPLEGVVPGAEVHGLRIAGRYVAWLEGGTLQAYSEAGIAVYDRVAGVVAYRVPHEAMRGDVNDFDLQDDGKVVFSVGARKGQVAWASPAEPRPHGLGLPHRDSYEVRIAGDRIGFEAGVSGEVGISDLDGHWRRLGNLAEGSAATDDFDFDGERLAWWSFGCTRAFVHLTTADGPPALSRARSGCRLRFTRKPSIARGAARLHVDCFGFYADRCYARHVRLVAVVGGARRRVLVGAGKSARRVVLTAAGRKLLRRHRVLHVRASATLRDGSGRRERRSGPLALAAN